MTEEDRARSSSPELFCRSATTILRITFIFQDGVNWLAFLNRYKLHGILCDDMGLGKTLQSICILAGDHYYREQEYKVNICCCRRSSS